MMDNALYNFLISTGVNLKCQNHRKESIIQICQNLSCNRNPLICQVCPDNHSDHSTSIIPFTEWLSKVSKAIEEGMKIQKLFKEENWEQVLKWCEDDEMHLKKVEEHCNAQRQLIGDDLNQVRRLFNEKCVTIQQSLDLILTDFVTKYKEAFKSAKQTIDESWLLFKMYSPYSNPNNLIFKLQQSNTEETKSIAYTLKSIIQKIKQIESDKFTFQENLKNIAAKVTDLTCSLPVFQFSEGIDNICNKLISQLQEHFKSKMQINSKNIQQSPKQTNQRQRLKEQSNTSFNSNRILQKQQSEDVQPFKSNSASKSPQRNLSTYQSASGFQISLNNKNVTLNQSISNVFSSSDITLKPLKKYQLDFQVSALEIVNETIYALACSNDNYLRIFDITQKRIHTLQSHNNPITIIQKSINGENGLNSTNINWNSERNSKNHDQKQQFLFTYSTDMLIVWNFEGRIPIILTKCSFPLSSVNTFCYLQDSTSLALGDKEGGIEIYNFRAQKTIQACIKGKHSKSITQIILIKRYDKFIAGGLDQSITIWRMLYNLSQFEKQYHFESSYCEQVLQFNGLGSISTINLLNSNLNLILVSTFEGNFKLINIQTGQLQIESESKNQNPLIDTVICEDVKIKFKSLNSQICAIGFSQNSKSLRFWKLSEKEEIWYQSEQKLEIAISNIDNQLKSKIQFTSMVIKNNNPLLLISNEANKELLVYEVISK